MSSLRVVLAIAVVSAGIYLAWSITMQRRAEASGVPDSQRHFRLHTARALGAFFGLLGVGTTTGLINLPGGDFT